MRLRLVILTMTSPICSWLHVLKADCSASHDGAWRVDESTDERLHFRSDSACFRQWRRVESKAVARVIASLSFSILRAQQCGTEKRVAEDAQSTTQVSDKLYPHTLLAVVARRTSCLLAQDLWSQLSHSKRVLYAMVGFRRSAGASAFLTVALLPAVALGRSLAELVRMGDLNGVKAGIEEGLDLNEPSPHPFNDIRGATPLMTAVLEHDPKVRDSLVTLLLEKGADVNYETPEQGVTALFIAVMQNAVSTCKLLLAQDDIELDATGRTGKHYLTMAAQQGHAEVAALFIDAGSDVNRLSPPPIDATPLIMAAAKGRVEVAQQLLEAGARLDLENSRGVSAHVAALLDVPVSPRVKEMMVMLLNHHPPVSSAEEHLFRKLCTGPELRCEAIEMLHEYREAEQFAAGPPILQWLRRKWYLSIVAAALLWQRYERSRRRKQEEEHDD